MDMKGRGNGRGGRFAKSAMPVSKRKGHFGTGGPGSEGSSVKGVVLDTHLRSALLAGGSRGTGRRLMVRCDRGILLIPAGRGISGLLGRSLQAWGVAGNKSICRHRRL